MLSVNKLEKVIELEEKLRAQYEAQVEEKKVEIERLAARQAELEATVAKQLETISELSTKAVPNQRTEQLNRELSNRVEKLQDEVSDLKKRAKTLQKELVEERAENKSLKQYDPARMKKNLDATKKKLAEKTRANELLQKSANKAKGENAELQRRVEELEAKLAEAEENQQVEENQQAEEAAA
jgi:chromosome segregation ATPase